MTPIDIGSVILMATLITVVLIISSYYWNAFEIWLATLWLDYIESKDEEQ